MLYGHRNDVAGYARAMTEFDGQLAEFLTCMRPEDVLILTADHGCDPSTPSTDHSRECTPLLIFGEQVRAGVDLGTRATFADIGRTVTQIFDVPSEGLDGTGFWDSVKI